ncbi:MULTISPECIES: hypothetical protein [Alteribacter]|uniref:DUF3089 domain-containing protein n=1 Tax=Alteribacter keqinensis TaxID=2483800 RepID=A0A3M7TPQ3_9BACI|nr:MULTISPECIES: hypothetical protein [Alteribacter]MBM7095252.1 hypothetical protein [Alteribacter salitolerans]RNA66997.1 hypothetical protein EBO34_17545 [Alteribacter keqinensis]
MKSQAHGRFVDLQREAFSAFEQKDYEGVRKLVKKIDGAFPKQRHRTVMWKMCSFALEGERDKAFEIGFEALDEGIWWNPDRIKEEPGLADLQEDPRFETFVARCRVKYNEERDTRDPVLVSMGNPLSHQRLFAIHWRGDDAESFSEYFETTPRLADWHMGFPQSSQVHGYSRFCWDDEEKALMVLKKSYEAFDEISVGGGETLLCGASQGGKLAIDLALRHQPVPHHCFFAVVPSIKDLKAYESLLKEGVCSKVKGYILTGENDPYLQQQRALHQLLLDYDVPCQFVVVEGLGHDFPENFNIFAEEAAAFLMK